MQTTTRKIFREKRGDRVPTPEQYVQSLYVEEDPALERVLQEIRRRGMPEISVSPPVGRLLTLLVRFGRVRDALEIGALGGYSAVCIARGLAEGGRLISLERDPAFADTARRNLAAAGCGDRVDVRVGEALDSLEQLEREGARFDFVLIDADKGNYPHYLEWAVRLSRPGALIVADNTLLQGRVADPDYDSPSASAMRRFNELIARDPRLESTMLPAFDGLAFARVKG
jgi:predicted O-methyltransferase YrrM